MNGVWQRLYHTIKSHSRLSLSLNSNTLKLSSISSSSPPTLLTKLATTLLFIPLTDWQLQCQVPTIGAVSMAPLKLNGSTSGAAVTSSAFRGSSLKRVSSVIFGRRSLSGNFKVCAQRNVTFKLNAWEWLALASLFIANANSKLDKPVSRAITNDDKHPGFISIDCGLTEDYYSDSETGIWYQTDKGFVETGENHKVSPDVDLNFPFFGKLLNTLRSFPSGNRNCYTLKPKQGKNNSYLIRAIFSYGNYDFKNQTPYFDLYIGVNFWDTIGVAEGYYYFSEIIHTPSTDTIDVCLVKTGPTIPYISALELRPVNGIYLNQFMSSTAPPQSLLYVEACSDMGAPSRPRNSRYKDDVYDRLWKADHDFTGWYPLVLNESVDIGTIDDAYKLPAQVWRSASMNASYSLDFDFDKMFWTLDKSSEYYVYFHFAEIKRLPPGQKRILNITLNSENILSQPLVLEYLEPVSITPQKATQGYVRFSISATSESDAPPILNALEVYRLIAIITSRTDTRDVDAILDIKSTYRISRVWQGDPCLPKQYAWEGLICSSDANPRITSLDLSSSNLAGEITPSFSYLTELESLDLSNNELEGSLPEFLAELPNLTYLNLTGNKLSGPIPKALMEKADLRLSVDDNPDLCKADSCKKKNFVTPLIASLSALIVILLICVGFWIFRRRQKVVRSESKEGVSLKSKNPAFSYSEILNITDNFNTIIGEGAFGKVYLGILRDETEVAVKLLSPSSAQGYKEFRAEAQLLMVVHHKNLVSLIGYCDEGEIKALVYEYMANGNLQQHLSERNPYILKWNERLKIAVDAAHGLDYLHNGCRPPLVHRDLKTSNILLDRNKQAKIADFGLCRAFVNDHISTRPAGTPGYVDPEYQRTGYSNKKSDIYSFGIILFELITGKPAIARVQGEIIHIVQWATPIVERGDIQNIVDPRLQGEFNINSAWKAVEIALSCISPTAAERPDISQIMVELKECLSLETIQGLTKTESALGLTSLEIGSDVTPIAR